MEAPPKTAYIRTLNIESGQAASQARSAPSASFLTDGRLVNRRMVLYTHEGEAIAAALAYNRRTAGMGNALNTPLLVVVDGADRGTWMVTTDIDAAKEGFEGKVYI